MPKMLTYGLGKSQLGVCLLSNIQMGKGRISPPNGLKSHSITQETMRSKEKQKKRIS